MRPSGLFALALVGCQRPEVASADIDVGETSHGLPDPGEDPSISSTSASSVSATSPSDDDSGATTQGESSTPTSSGDSSTASSSDASDAESSSADGSDGGMGELPDGDYICATLITDSGINPIAGSISGRLALHVNGGSVEIADVGDDCEWNVISTFPHAGPALRMSGDGTRLLSIEKWSENGDSARDGTRIYDLPSGDLLWGGRPTLISSVMIANDVSDDGSVFSMFWGSTGIGECMVLGEPFGSDTLSYCNLRPRVAPSGDYIVASAGAGNEQPDLSGSWTTIYGADGAIAQLDGLVHGFVDADHVLVSRYGDWDGADFLGSAIVAMDGSSVATTDLPDIRYLTLVSDGEVIGLDNLNQPKIYDVYSETILWAPSRGGVIAPAGPNHLLWSTGVHVYLLRWR